VNYVNKPKNFGSFSYQESIFTVGKVLWPRFSNTTACFRHLTLELPAPKSCGPQHFLKTPEKEKSGYHPEKH